MVSIRANWSHSKLSAVNLTTNWFWASLWFFRYLASVPLKQTIGQEINFLKGKLSQLDSPIVFCHNDLLLGNVIYSKEEDRVTFIDYEYSGLNYQAYDIGNHFAEFVGTYLLLLLLLFFLICYWSKLALFVWCVKWYLLRGFKNDW